MGTNYVGNFGWGESGGYNQTAGDQTGTEGCVKAFYIFHGVINGVLRYPNENLARHAAADMAKIAKSNLVGYDMSWANGRNSLYIELKKNGWNVDKYLASGVKTEADCSASVYAIWCCYVPALREYYETTSYASDKYHNCTTTYCMKEVWTKYGFKWLTDSKYTTTGANQIPGDVYVNIMNHTNMAVNYGSNTGKSQTIEYTLASAPNTDGSSTATVETEKVTETTVNKKYTITASTLNIRSGYSTDYSVLGSIKKGVTVTVTVKSSNGWGKTTYNGVTGWISLSYAKEVTTSTATTTTSTTATATSTATATTTATSKVTSLTATSKTVFTVSKTGKPSETKQFEGTVSVTSDDTLNVRTWAGTENATCSFSPLKPNVKVDVCDAIQDKSGATWYFIKYNSKFGFASAKYIK